MDGGAAVLVGAGVLWIRLDVTVVGSRLDLASDPHGYRLVLGLILGCPVGPPGALGAGLLAPHGRRVVVLAEALAVWFVVTAVLVVLVLTTPRWEPPDGVSESRSGTAQSGTVIHNPGREPAEATAC